MKRRFFRRIFILYFIVLLISVVFIEFYITNVVRTNYINDLKESLFIQASLISENILFEEQKNLDYLCRQLKEKAGARVTLVYTDGKVMGDSDTDSFSMENHANRPEIQQASLSGTGWAIRHSSTLQYDLLYTTKKIMKDGKILGFIRLAVPLADVKKSINNLRLKINLVVILLFLSSGIILILQTERIRKFVNQIADHAGALAHGLFKKKLYLEGAGEFTELAHNLNNMASELQETIDRRDAETSRLSVILKSIPDALLLININGTIELSNRAAWELFDRPDLDGRPFIEVVRNPAFSSLIDKVKQDRRSSSDDLVIDSPEEKYLSIRVSPLFYEVGELAGIVAIFHDTTHLKKLEQMRKDFVANVSHEMKTPVTAIKGFAETLLDGALYDRDNAEKFLHTIKSHSERLNRLVEDLLMLSRIELGVIKMDKTEINISDIIDRVIGTFVVQAAEKNLTVKKSIKAGESILIADEHRIEQIILNLIDNAIKFTEAGEIEIGIEREGGRSYLFVKDTGIGVQQKYLHRLGERFFRVDPSRSRELGGTGLGLAIVKHLVKAHGWEMKIESEAGQGTIVKIFY